MRADAVMGALAMSDRYRDFYKEESELYDDRRFKTMYGRVFAALHHRMLTEFFADLESDAHIIDVGCGTGHTSRLLLKLGFHVTGLDLNRSMIEQAPDVFEHQRFEFAEGDAFDLPFDPNRFHAATATRFLHLFGDSEQLAVLSELSRVVRAGSRVVVDYDNSTSHAALLPFLTVYNVTRYRRLAPDTNYNSKRDIEQSHPQAGLRVERILGVAGYHLVVPALVSKQLAIEIGKRQAGSLARVLGEQLLVKSTKL